MKKNPHYVKRANCWCVTETTWGEKKEKQEVHWFSDKESAWEFYKK